MYHADNDFEYEPTSEDIQDWHNAPTCTCHHRQLSCGCCTSGCVCWIHQSFPGEMTTCDYHKTSPHTHKTEPHSEFCFYGDDPFVSLTKEGEFGAPVYVFTRKSGQRLELNSGEYAKLVNSQR